MALTPINGAIISQTLNDNFSYLESSKAEALYYNVKNSAYGAVGNGITDDTAAIKAAVSAAALAGGGVVFLPKGIYRITSTITITANVSFQGAGADSTNLDTTPRLTKSISALLWGGTSGSAVIEILGNVGGISFRDFAIDGGRVGTDVTNAVNIGLDIDRTSGSYFSNLIIENCKTNCLRILPRATSGANDCTLHNVFSGIQLNRAEIPFYIDGNAHGNTCHNLFEMINSDYYTKGYYLGDCDSNTFTMIRTYRRSGTDYGLYLKDSTTRANNFYHIEVDGCYVGAGSKNSIFGYNRENGQANPTVVGTGKLFWSEDGNNAESWNFITSMRGIEIIIEGDWTANTTAIVEPEAFKLLRGGNGQEFVIAMDNATRETRFWVSQDGSGPYNACGLNTKGFEWFNLGAKRHTYGSASSTATATQGDIIYNTLPISGGYTGWICTVSGTPGTWRTFGLIT